MAPEMSSSQTTQPVAVPPAAVSPTSTSATPANPPQQTTSSENTRQQPPQQQGQFQSAYFQQDPRAYGQPFQPYGAPQNYTGQLNQYQQQQQQQQYQYQYQQQLQQQQQAYVNTERKGWTFIKIALHAVDIIFCICAIGLSFSLNNGYSSAGYAFMLCTPVFFTALIWDAAEIITWIVRKRQAGIHPGAHVGVSLLIWMAAAVIGGIQSTYVAFSVYDYGYSSCWDSDKQEYVECEDSYAAIRGRFLAVAVFSCLVWAIHFALFVGACVDTAKRNAALRRVMVVAPPYWGTAVQGYQPMPQYYPQSPGLNQGQTQGQGQQNAMMTPAQNIPLQTRSPAPTEQSGKGKEVDRGESSTQPAAVEGGIKEYYTPSSN